MTRRIFRHTTLVLLAVLWGVTPAAAQPTGAVRGRVVDQTGLPLPGVSVEVHRPDSTAVVTTDAGGRYAITGIEPGAVELTFRLLNFAVLRRPVAVTPGGSATLDVLLTLALNADVTVTARATFRNIADVDDPAGNLVGIAGAASQGAVTGAQLEARPMMRPGEVLETVPGMIVSQHSGEGKANQYYLRGFNLDHGSDFSMTVAGVPVNTPTGAHAHGYADVSFLIPELVSGVQYKKGPYFADEGDFSAAGAANVNYLNVVDAPSVTVSGGSHTWGRLFGVASPKVAGGHLLMAVDWNRSDGPWERPDDYEKLNGVVRFSRGDTLNGFSVTGTAFRAGWESTDQVPRRAIDSGLISRYGLVDPTDHGHSNRVTVSADLQRSFGASSLRGSVFVLRNNLDLFSNFTYYLDDPINGDQFEQRERRTALGGRLVYRRLSQLFDRHTESAVGVQVRHDRLSPVGLYHTAGAVRLETTREDRVGQTLTGAYAQTEIEWTRRVRTTFGVRGDVYAFDVQSNDLRNSGQGSAALASPKVSAAFGPWRGTELYANAGMGFHSNDARGAVITVDPSSGERAERVTPLVRARGAEVGLRSVAIPGLQSTVAVWFLDLDSELLFVGDAGTTEAGRPSRRAGIEWANYWRVRKWLTVDADLSLSRARFIDPDPAGSEVPGALARVISAGMTVEPGARVFGSLRLRQFGSRPLVEDGSVRSAGTTLWNGELGYRVSARTRIVGEAFNLFDAKVSDIDYYYRSRLPGEVADGFDDVHTHPALPRSVRIALQLSF